MRPKQGRRKGGLQGPSHLVRCAAGRLSEVHVSNVQLHMVTRARKRLRLPLQVHGCWPHEVPALPSRLLSPALATSSLSGGQALADTRQQAQALTAPQLQSLPAAPDGQRASAGRQEAQAGPCRHAGP